MRQLSWAPSFTRAARRCVRWHPELQRRLRDTLQQLASDPFDPLLDTHKLRGPLSGLWACSVARNCRIVFDLVGSGGEGAILLIDIGSHDEVY